jgi:hypothetical protein
MKRAASNTSSARNVKRFITNEESIMGSLLVQSLALGNATILQ